MSGTRAPAAPVDTTPPTGQDPAAVDPPYAPSHVLSSEDDDAPVGGDPTSDQTNAGGDQTQGNEPGSDPTDDPARQGKSQRTPEQETADKEARRIAHLTRQRYAEKARADAAEAARAALEERLRKLENPNGQQQPDLDKLVEQRVAERIAAREIEARVADFHTAGRAAYSDWQERCQTLMDMGADAAMSQMLIELPNGADVAGSLADDHDALERIASLPSERARAIALGRYSAELAARAAAPPAAAPAARRPAAPLPAPIRPPSSGRARGEPDPNGSMDDYNRWSSTVNWSNR